jgi:hypothetical protein
MSEIHEGSSAVPVATPRPGEKPAVKIHRVCIGCNNMFEVTMDNYEAKHCPACHKA